MNSEKIKELIVLISSGDQSAFRSLFLYFFPKVKHFITHMIKDESLAEDFSQDIFVKLWERRKTLTGLESFNSYIYQMSRNTVFNYFKKESIANKYYEDKLMEKAQTFTVEEEFFAREIELLTELTVMKMPVQRRTVYEMSRIKGLSNSEIAGNLGITKKTVENHLNIALKEIKKSISLLMIFFY